MIQFDRSNSRTVASHHETRSRAIARCSQKTTCSNTIPVKSGLISSSSTSSSPSQPWLTELQPLLRCDEKQQIPLQFAFVVSDPSKNWRKSEQDSKKGTRGSWRAYSSRRLYKQPDSGSGISPKSEAARNRSGAKLKLKIAHAWIVSSSSVHI